MSSDDTAPCFAHFTLKCPICFPTTTTAHTRTSGANNQQQAQATQLHNNAYSGTTSIIPAPATSSVSPAGIISSLKTGSDTTSVTVTTVKTSENSANFVIPGDSSTTTLPADSSSASPVKSGNHQSRDSTATESGGIEGTKNVEGTATSPTTAEKDDATTTSVVATTVKRKVDHDPSTASKKTKTIIDCEIALEIFRGDLHLTNEFFNSGKVLAWALQPDDIEFQTIHDYVAVGQEHGFGVKVLNILRIIPNATQLDEVPLSFNDDPDAAGLLRMMLWHGTTKEAVPSILENGLRLPYGHGQMFGAGIYFADRVSKSCGYCGGWGRYRSTAGSTAYLFLCDVLLGSIYKATSSFSGRSPPSTYNGLFQWSTPNNSVQGEGFQVPDKAGDLEIDGSVWPLGKTVLTRDTSKCTVQFNEYVVYDTEQVQPKYLVKVQFTPKPHYENPKLDDDDDE